MKKTAVLLICFFIGNISFSQKMMTRSGEIKFDATVPNEVEIIGINKTASCILDESNGHFVALVLVKAFKFKAPLMEEHFNENYMESSQFPKSTFDGKIISFDASKLSSTKTSYDLEGDLTIHGVTKKIKTKISLILNAGKITAASTFSVKAADYKIDIPNLVKEKFAENIKITLNFVLEEK
ncbi:YceI family protein [Flavobacterium luteum]|uniref:YceI family protein n=1 Tax=Flavobacterium luteum TaxID=2026654 RepID=A0A7J5ADG6_9FLAO|nr:YceI family protein [Flavobacterium luteum]KAB1155089.1 YceI family protein [Flavobacterium luteum]